MVLGAASPKKDKTRYCRGDKRTQANASVNYSMELTGDYSPEIQRSSRQQPAHPITNRPHPKLPRST